MCYSLFAALFSKTFLSHPHFKYPRSAPAGHGNLMTKDAQRAKMRKGKSLQNLPESMYDRSRSGSFCLTNIPAKNSHNNPNKNRYMCMHAAVSLHVTKIVLPNYKNITIHKQKHLLLRNRPQQNRNYIVLIILKFDTLS